MAKLIRIQRKRRRENRTDYESRFSLLKSGVKRIAIRKTNRFILIQLVESKESQDRVLNGITSKLLISEGWSEKFSGALKSIPAGYLTGLLFAKKIDNKEKYIIDLGIARNKKGSRLYAAVLGLIDGGLNICADKKVMPSKEDVEGKNVNPNLKEIIKKVKAKIVGGKK
jgi:large subunit ribosomal protein L18